MSQARSFSVLPRSRRRIRDARRRGVAGRLHRRTPSTVRSGPGSPARRPGGRVRRAFPRAPLPKRRLVADQTAEREVGDVVQGDARRRADERVRDHAGAEFDGLESGARAARGSSTRSIQPVATVVPGAARSSSDSSWKWLRTPLRLAGRVHEAELAARRRTASAARAPGAARRCRRRAAPGSGRDPDVRPQLRVVRVADGRDDRQAVPAAVHREHDQNVAGVGGIRTAKATREASGEAATAPAVTPIAASMLRRVRPRRGAQHSSGASLARRGPGICGLIVRSSSGVLKIRLVTTPRSHRRRLADELVSVEPLVREQAKPTTAARCAPASGAPMSRVASASIDAADRRRRVRAEQGGCRGHRHPVGPPAADQPEVGVPAAHHAAGGKPGFGDVRDSRPAAASRAARGPSG